MNPNVLKRFIIYMAILTFVMFTVWALVRSFMNRPQGDYETEVCDIRLKDKKYDEAIDAANIALEKTPNHRGAIMCKSLVYISQKQYREATDQLDYLIKFLKKLTHKKITLIDKYNIDGDFIESQAFGYLAIRSYLKKNISFPETTKVKKPVTGGEIVSNF